MARLINTGRKRLCCFCRYFGNGRSFAWAPTQDHPDDYLCELCATP